MVFKMDRDDSKLEDFLDFVEDLEKAEALEESSETTCSP